MFEFNLFFSQILSLSLSLLLLFLYISHFSFSSVSLFSLSLSFLSLSHVDLAHCFSFNTVCKVARYRGFDPSLNMNKIHLSVYLSFYLYLSLNFSLFLFFHWNRLLPLFIFQTGGAVNSSPVFPPFLNPAQLFPIHRFISNRRMCLECTFWLMTTCPYHLHFKLFDDILSLS